MNILVINGSPKGENSITLQTVLYLQKKFPEHEWHELHAGQKIRAIEKDFAQTEKEIGWAELILFSYPVYTFIAPSQLHRLISLIKEHGISLQGKFISQITTSKHFYDVTAHRYIEENCFDLDARVIHGLSADMDDLLDKKGREQARQFFEHLMFMVEHGIIEPESKRAPAFIPADTHVPERSMDGEHSGDVVILTDLGENQQALKQMIDRFRAIAGRKTRVINLREYPFSGGCLGCFHCAADGTCIYKDGFDQFLRNDIQTAEAIIYAFSIRDHSMGDRFKMYDDRQFCNGHRTVTMGMPQGYLIDGAYSREENLRMIIEGRAQVGGNYLCGVATNETNPDLEIDHLALNLNYALKHRYEEPKNFLGVGGMKIFRDLIYLMRGMMRADHKFFKSHGQYDFPQKKKATAVKMYAVGVLINNRKIQKKIGNRMTEGMLAPYKKAIEED